MAERALQLRVLSGLHQGASCAAGAGALIGADSACDIVLADPGMPAQAARLSAEKNTWGLVYLSDQNQPENHGDAPGAQTTALNQSLTLYGVAITLAPEHAPWPTAPDTPAAAAPAPPAAPGADAASDAQTSAAPASAPPEARAPTAPRNTPVAARAAARERRTWLLLVAGTTLALAFIIVLLLAWLLPPAPENPSAASTPDLARQSLAQVNAVLRELGLEQKLQVQLGDSGVVKVSGWVRDESQLEQLAQALSRVWPMPALAVSSEQEALAAANSVLQAYQINFQARYLGAGELGVVGVARDSTEIENLLGALHQRLPGMSIQADAVELADLLQASLVQKLQAATLPALQVSWQGKWLQVAGALEEESQWDLLQAILAQFNGALAFPVARLDADTQGLGVASSVPFEIRSVISGPAPYLLLADGSKLAVGGSHGRYTLSAIDEHQITFDGPRPVVIER